MSSMSALIPLPGSTAAPALDAPETTTVAADPAMIQLLFPETSAPDSAPVTFAENIQQFANAASDQPLESPVAILLPAETVAPDDIVPTPEPTDEQSPVRTTTALGSDSTHEAQVLSESPQTSLADEIFLPGSTPVELVAQQPVDPAVLPAPENLPVTFDRVVLESVTHSTSDANVSQPAEADIVASPAGSDPRATPSRATPSPWKKPATTTATSPGIARPANPSDLQPAAITPETDSPVNPVVATTADQNKQPTIRPDIETATFSVPLPDSAATAATPTADSESLNLPRAPELATVQQTQPENSNPQTSPASKVVTPQDDEVTIDTEQPDVKLEQPDVKPTADFASEQIVSQESTDHRDAPARDDQSSQPTQHTLNDPVSTGNGSSEFNNALETAILPPETTTSPDLVPQIAPLTNPSIEPVDTNAIPDQNSIPSEVKFVTAPELPNAVREQMVVMRDPEAGEPAEIEVRFDPPSLGRVRVIVGENDQREVQVRLFAMSPMTLDVIEHELPAMREMLENAGIEIGEFHVEQDRTESQGNQRQREDNYSGQRTNDFDDQPSEPETQQIIVNHLVDIVA